MRKREEQTNIIIIVLLCLCIYNDGKSTTLQLLATVWPLGSERVCDPAFLHSVCVSFLFN
jgi:hypothetical protein